MTIPPPSTSSTCAIVQRAAVFSDQTAGTPEVPGSIERIARTADDAANYLAHYLDAIAAVSSGGTAGGTPEEFAQLIRSESDKWGPIIKRTGATVD